MLRDVTRTELWETLLLLRARRGDREALGELLRDHGALVRRRLTRVLRSRGARALDLDDVLQDVAVAACRTIGELRTPDPRAFRAWLMRVARNRATDVHRRGQRPEPAAGDDRASELGAPASLASAGGSVRRERSESGLSTLSVLAFEERLALVLRDFLGTAWGTTSFLLRRGTDSAARNCYARARTRVRPRAKIPGERGGRLRGSGRAAP
jgi:DNA-directed RNA polymerase specialized sigma24 family protein